jgi:hypothetical protein
LHRAVVRKRRSLGHRSQRRYGAQKLLVHNGCHGRMKIGRPVPQIMRVWPPFGSLRQFAVELWPQLE